MHDWDSHSGHGFILIAKHFVGAEPGLADGLIVQRKVHHDCSVIEHLMGVQPEFADQPCFFVVAKHFAGAEPELADVLIVQKSIGLIVQRSILFHIS